MSFLDELRRRNVFRVAIAYGAAAWLVVQLVETVLPVFGVSDTTIRVIFVLLGIGFIPALVFSWIYEITPEGLRREKDVDRTVSITSRTGKTLDKLIILTLGIAVAYFAVDKFVLDPARDAQMLEQAISGGIADNSIAVLPFLNMSRDPENEYFSDGVSEELLNLLAQAGGLSVASRTSSFHFKGKDADIRQIADRLGVRYVLEGSVRKAGDLIRVTAQLIDSRSDSNLWSQTYDRELTDIFAVQDEIARRIVGELRTKLTEHDIGQPEGLSQTDNVEAYQLYLRGLSLLRLRGIDNLLRAAELFEQAIELDPQYARAYDKRAVTYMLVPFYSDRPREPWLQRAEQSALKAIELDPQLGGAYATLGGIYQADSGHGFLEADRAFRKAIELDPNHVTARQWYGELLMTAGRPKSFLEQASRAHKMDPLAPVVNASLAWAYLYNGDYDQAERFALTSLELGMGGTWAEDVLGLVYLHRRDYDKAREIFGRDHPDFALNRLVVDAVENPATVPAVLEAIEALDYNRISYWPVELIMLIGETDLALSMALQQIRDGVGDVRALWRPHFLVHAGDPRFRQMIEILVLDDYWDATEWPHFCRRSGEDFACDPAYIAM